MIFTITLSHEKKKKMMIIIIFVNLYKI